MKQAAAVQSVNQEADQTAKIVKQMKLNIKSVKQQLIIISKRLKQIDISQSQQNEVNKNELQQLNDQLYEFLNQLQNYAYELSSPIIHSNTPSKLIIETDQYLNKYMNKISKELQKLQRLLQLTQHSTIQPNEQIMRQKQERTGSNQGQHDQEKFRTLNQNTNIQTNLRANHVNSIQTLSNRKQSARGITNDAYKSINFTSIDRNSRSSLEAQTSNNHHHLTLSPQSIRSNMKSMLSEQIQQNKQPQYQQNKVQQFQKQANQQHKSIDINTRNRSNQLLSQDLQNFQTNYKTRNTNQAFNQFPYSQQENFNQNNPIQENNLLAMPTYEQLQQKQSLQQILISPITNDTFQTHSVYRGSSQESNKLRSIHKQIPLQIQQIQPISQFNQGIETNNLPSSQSQERQIVNKQVDPSQQNKFQRVKPKVHELPLQVNSPSQRVSSYDTPFLPEQKLQKQIEIYHQDLQRLNIEVDIEKLKFQERQMNLVAKQTTGHQAQIQVNHHKSKSQRQDKSKSLKRENSKQKSNKINIDDNQQQNPTIIKNEMNEFQNALQNQKVLQINREQKLKIKLLASKEKYSKKIQEYKLYIESLKVKNLRLNQELENAQLQLQPEGQNVNSQITLILFYEKCMNALQRQLDKSLSDDLIQDQIVHEINILLDRDQIHQSQIQSQMNEIENLLSEQENFSNKIRSLEELIRNQNPCSRREGGSGKSSFNRLYSTKPNEMSQKTLDITARFDKLKNEIKKVQEIKRNMEIQSPQNLSRAQSPIVENRLRQLDENQKVIKQEDRVEKIVMLQEQNLKQSIIKAEQLNLGNVRQSTDRDILDTQERSDIHSNTITNLKEKLEGLQYKIENQNSALSPDLKSDIEDIKSQIRELKEFKSQQQMSPVPIRRQQHERLRSIEYNPQLTRQSIEEQLKTKGFRLGARLDIQVDSSSNFDSLHDVCNHQIDELKKTIRLLCDEKDLIISQLDGQRDENQILVNEKMELEIMYNTKLNEIQYLHRYLDDSEGEIRQLKQALEDQFKSMKNEIGVLEEKLLKIKSKKKGLEEKIEMKEIQHHQMMMFSSKENSSIYMGAAGGGYLGTPGIALSHNQSISNDINPQRLYQDGRIRNDSSVGQSLHNSNQKQLNLPKSFDRIQNSQSQQNLQILNTAQANHQQTSRFTKLSSSTNHNSPSRNQSQPRPIRALVIDVPLDDYDENNRNLQGNFNVNQNTHQSNIYQRSLLEQADNHQHFNPISYQNENYDKDLLASRNQNSNLHSSAQFLIQPNNTNATDYPGINTQSKEELKVIQYEELQYQSQSNYNQSNQHENPQLKHIRKDSINDSNYYGSGPNNLITPNSYLMMQYNQQQKLRDQNDYVSLDINNSIEEDIDISNTFKPPQTQPPSTMSVKVKQNNQQFDSIVVKQNGMNNPTNKTESRLIGGPAIGINTNVQQNLANTKLQSMPQTTTNNKINGKFEFDEHAISNDSEQNFTRSLQSEELQ
eukprot:403355829